MPEHTPPGKGPLIGAGVALAVAIVVPLLVWTYAKADPELWGIPFFFWYQFLLVIGVGRPDVDRLQARDRPRAQAPPR